jgi:ABC-2 type transport system ATP-binding protein
MSALNAINPDMNLIEISHLYRIFGDVVAVDDISLEVAAGEIYGLVGPDGAGKTTTMRLICGAYQPSYREKDISPIIRIGGYDVITQTEQAREQIGYLPQRFSLYEELTVLENIRFFSEARGLKETEWRPRCMEILEFVGLDEFLNRRAGNLSGGMKQKLGLAAAIVNRPRILLLDEPTTGVDPVTRQDFWRLIIRLVAKNDNDDHRSAVFVSTPYMDEAARCTRIGFMVAGRLAVEGTPAELRSRLDDRVLELIGTPLPSIKKLAAADEHVESVQMFGDSLHIRVQEGCAENVIKRLPQLISSQGWQISRIRIIPPQLEDVFIHMVETEHE